MEHVSDLQFVTPEPELAPPIDHLVAYINPAGARADDAQLLLRGIRQALGDHVPYTVIETELNPAHTYEKLDAIGHTIGPNTLVALFTGDGGARHYGSWATQPETPAEARKAQVLFTESGGANDGTHSTLDRETIAAPELVVLDPNRRLLRALHPISVTSTRPDGTQEVNIALTDAGLGMNAAGAGAINDKKSDLHALLKARKWLRYKKTEFATAIGPGFEIPTFTAVPITSIGEGQPITDIVDILVLNGSVMAKHARGRTTHHQPEVHCTITRTKQEGYWRFPRLGANGLLLAIGLLPADVIPMLPGNVLAWDIQPQEGEASVTVQLDGDTTEAVGRVEIRPALPFTVIANRS